MASVEYDVVVTRTDPKTDKKYYTNIGRVMKNDKGLFMKLDSVPIGWDGWASFYVPKPKEDRGAAPAPKPSAKPAGKIEDMDDDIPF